MKDLPKERRDDKFSDSPPVTVPDTAVPAANLARKRENRIVCDRS